MMRRVLLCCGAATLAGVVTVRVLPAQALDRTQQPKPAPAAPFKFPATTTLTLDNGLRVIVVENHSLPLVSVRVVLGADSLDDPAGKEGLFALDTAMMREGTTTMTPDEQAAAVALLGNSVSPLRFVTLTNNFSRSLELMADMLVHPTFPQAAVDRQKSALVAARRRQMQSASTEIRQILFARLFGADHPITRSVIGPESSAQAITRDDIVRFHASYMAPNYTTIVVVGDVTAAVVRRLAAKDFAGWQRSAATRAALPAAPAAQTTTIYLLDKPIQQALVFVGSLGPSRASPDFAALDVMGPVLGNSPGSRLQQNLRERHSYMYSSTPAAVVWVHEPALSMIYGSAALNSAKIDSAMIEWMGELKDIRVRAPTDHEMTLARGVLTGALTSAMETNDRLADHIATLVRNGLPMSFDDSFVTRIDKVRPADVLAAAQRHVHPDRTVIVIAGNRAQIEPLLRAANIAPIVVVDDKGNPVP